MTVKGWILHRKPASLPSSVMGSSSKSSKSDKASEHWIAAIEGAILIFSDQQIVTGISILISGFSQLHTGLSSYHWQSVVNLAWLSSVTHLITLTSLRRQARENIPFRWWRIIAMSIMAVVLIGALVPVGYLTVVGSIPYSFPAWCLYHPGLQWSNYHFTDDIPDFYPDIYPVYNSFYIMLAVVILVWSYLSRMWTLFPNHDWLTNRWCWAPLEDSFRKRKAMSGPTGYFLFDFYIWAIESALSKLDALDLENSGLKFLALITYSIIRSGYTFLLSGYHLFNSRLWEVCIPISKQRIFMLILQSLHGLHLPSHGARSE
jgi:hypothetical protein